MAKVHTQKIKAIIFDFDDTLESWYPVEQFVEKKIAEEMLKEHKISEKKFLRTFKKVKAESVRKKNNPIFYGRDFWFKGVFQELGILVTKNLVDKYVNMYWRLAFDKAVLLPHVKPTLQALKKEYKIAMLTDSDGYRSIKIKRVKKLGIHKYFDIIVTSDEVGKNKPNLECFEMVLDKLKVDPEECIMVGDHPEVDLQSAKKIGMHTVLMESGFYWHKESKFDYIDYKMKDIRDLMKYIVTIESDLKKKIRLSSE